MTYSAFYIDLLQEHIFMNISAPREDITKMIPESESDLNLRILIIMNT